MKQRIEDKFKSGIYVIQNNINGKPELILKGKFANNL